MVTRIITTTLSATLVLAGTAQSYHTAVGGARWQSGVGLRGTDLSVLTVAQDASAADGPMAMRLLSTGPVGTDVNWTDLPSPHARFAQAVLPVGNDLLICGSMIRQGRHDQDALVLLVSPTGTVLWEWSTDTPGSEEQLLAVAGTDDGGYVLGGMQRDAADSDALVVRLSATGSLLWQRRHGIGVDEKLLAIAPQGSGYTGAGIITNAPDDSDGYVLRMDADGNELNWQSHGETRNDGFRAMVPMGEAVVLAGYQTDPNGTMLQARKRLRLMALAPAGDTLWTRTIATPTVHLDAHAITLAANGDLLVGGTREQNHRSEAFLVRLSPTGSVLWERRVAVQRHAVVKAIQPFADGGFLATGHTFGTSGGQVLLLRKNANGL